MEVLMLANSINRRLIFPFAIGAAIASGAYSQQAPKMSRDEVTPSKSSLIAEINKREIDESSGETLRDMYVPKLSELNGDVQDPELVNYFLDLIQNDPNEWVRLEAAADIGNLNIPDDMVVKVNTALDKARKLDAVNFQVLAARAKIKVNKKKNKQDMESVKSIALIAQGKDQSKWKIMIPPHNKNTMIAEPGSKTKIPFEDFFKTELRINAMDGLAISGDDFSKKTLKELEKDGNATIKQKATEFRTKNQ
jgi:hypothetical protein